MNGILIVVAGAILVVGVLLAVGSAAAIGALAMTAWHVSHRGPWWYARAVLLGGLVGGGAGFAIAAFVVWTAQGGLPYAPHVLALLTFGGFGWTAILPAGRFWRQRLEPARPPL